MPEGFLFVKWGVHTFDQIPLQVAPGVLIGYRATQPCQCNPSLDRPRPSGTWPLSSRLGVVVVRYKVSRRALEVKTDDLSPLTLGEQRVICRTVSYWYGRAVCFCVGCFMERKSVWLNCSGAERSKCTVCLSLRLIRLLLLYWSRSATVLLSRWLWSKGEEISTLHLDFYSKSTGKRADKGQGRELNYFVEFLT